MKKKWLKPGEQNRFESGITTHELPLHAFDLAATPAKVKQKLRSSHPQSKRLAGFPKWLKDPEEVIEHLADIHAGWTLAGQGQDPLWAHPIWSPLAIHSSNKKAAMLASKVPGLGQFISPGPAPDPRHLNVEDQRPIESVDPGEFANTIRSARQQKIGEIMNAAQIREELQETAEELIGLVQSGEATLGQVTSVIQSLNNGTIQQPAAPSNARELVAIAPPLPQPPRSLQALQASEEGTFGGELLPVLGIAAIVLVAVAATR